MMWVKSSVGTPPNGTLVVCWAPGPEGGTWTDWYEDDQYFYHETKPFPEAWLEIPHPPVEEETLVANAT